MSQKKNEITEIEEKELPEEINEVLEGIPAPKRKEIERIFVSHYQMIARISPETEISRKVTSEHITSMLASDEKAMEYSFKESNYKKIYTIILLLITFGALIGFILLLRNDSETLQKLLIGVISLVAGAFGGYGYGSRRNNNED